MIKKAKPVRMFGLKINDDLQDTVAFQAKYVREQTGNSFNFDDHKVGWEEAKKYGYRVVPVIVTEA